MSIIKKAIIIVTSIVVIIFLASVILLGIFEGGFFFMAPSYSKMDRYLKNNIDMLSHVADALFELDYDFISIRENSQLREEEKNSMKVSREYLVYETIPIPDELLSYIEALHKSGVSVISCGRDSIGFSMWSIMSESRGIRYSKTGLTLDDGQYIEVRQLSKANWYYYVNNFEKWKARNPHLFP